MMMIVMMMMVFISNTKINAKMKMIKHIYTRHIYFCPGNFEQLPERTSYQNISSFKIYRWPFEKVGITTFM